MNSTSQQPLDDFIDKLENEIETIRDLADTVCRFTEDVDDRNLHDPTRKLVHRLSSLIMNTAIEVQSERVNALSLRADRLETGNKGP